MSDSGSPSLRVSPRAAQTSLYVAGFIALGLVDGGVGPSLSTFAANAGVSLGEIAIIVAAMALGRLTGSAIADRPLPVPPLNPHFATAARVRFADQLCFAGFADQPLGCGYGVSGWWHVGIQ